MIHAVLPAAGRSSRLGRGKALLPWADSTIVDRVAGCLARGGAGRLVVVAAAGDEALPRHCARRGLECATNPRPERGMLSSVVCGMRELEGDLAPEDVLLICPVDFPLVAPRTVATLVAALEGGGSLTAVPVHAGRRGHPLAARGSLAPAVRSLDPEVGLRQLLDRHPPLEVQVDDLGVLRDLDTWLDYLELRALA